MPMLIILGRLRPLGVSLCIETVEAVLEVLKEGVAVSVALWQRKSHVVAVQGVGNDELVAVCAITLAYLHPKGQVIPVVISVVGKAAKVGHDLVCVRVCLCRCTSPTDVRRADGS